MTKFNWQDPLQLNDQLTEEERMIADVSAQYAKEKLAPRILEEFRGETCDTKIFREMGELGFLGAIFPAEYGGSELNHVSLGLINREMERVDTAYRTLMSVQTSLVMLPIFEFGTEAAKQQFLPKLATGELIGCFALTEPNAGSDPAGMTSKAKKVDGGWQLNGTKTWITNSPIADVFIVWANDEENKLRGFILEKSAKGLSAPPIHGKIALRASSTGEVVMNNVFVPDEHAFPDVRGLKGPFTALNSARFGIAWGVWGAAEDCWYRTLEYCLDRKQFGRPLAQTQLIQTKLANMQTEISLGLQAAMRIAQLKDQGKLTPEAISMLKRNAGNKALQIARDARDMLGGNGIVDEYGVMRHMVNLEAVNTYEGAHDIQGLILGRAQTGLSAF